MSKTGQIEMIGLVIVVIIIVIGLLFYLKFGILREAQNNVVEDPSMQQAYVINLMGAILNMQVCGSEYNPAPKIEEALIQCLQDFSGDSNGVYCNDLGSCDYAKEEIGKIIGEVGLKNYQKYSVLVNNGDNSVNVINGCETGIVGRTIVISEDNDHYTVEFRVC